MIACEVNIDVKMAYCFPPRGFVSPVNNQQFPPHFDIPPFPTPRQSFQGSPRPPRDFTAGPDRPPFAAGALQFRPRPAGRFSHAIAPAYYCDRPGERGVWAGGVRAGTPGVIRGPFPVQTPTVPARPDQELSWFHHPANKSNDITECESWPGFQGKKDSHQVPFGGLHKNNQRNGSQNFTKGKLSTWKSQKQNKPFKKKRRRKPSSTEKQVSTQLEFYCDVCDRGFKSKALIDEHFAEHVKCKHEGCKFEAHFKVVKLHSKLQHGPGSKRVAWLDTPAEVSKWRAERKRNYPSLSNIAKKAETLRNNKEKGVVLENKYFGKMRQPKRGWQKRREVAGDNAIDAKKSRMDDAKSSQDTSAGSKMSDKDLKAEISTCCDVTYDYGEVTSAGHLGSLSALAAYDGPSDEEEGEIREDAPKHEEMTPPQKPSTSTRRNSRGWKPSWKGTRGKKTTRGTKAGQKVKERLEKQRQERLKRRPNLLEMLLAPEIRRERNIILQCVRYVVQNNFFDRNQTEETNLVTKQVSENGLHQLEDSVREEFQVNVRETNGDVSFPKEDVCERGSNGQTAETGTTYQVHDQDDSMHSEIAGKHLNGAKETDVESPRDTEEQVASQEKGDGELNVKTEAGGTQDRGSLSGKGGIKSVADSAVASSDGKERTEGIRDIRCSALDGPDMEGDERLAVNERQNQIFQNGASCDLVISESNADTNTNGI
ncbi:nuclear fragile X mental retardation-interacting protein 1-like [Acanthaster planci]|uniref:Nuclear fragile X mental retardation-interacting protein 1-like n=1 Tax=Acanthaster planci TaxID=133434 RepID=A0A8B7YRX3_ACAPL|nr:nuclear fragile X mental retardation-interacting protein 1-like [Acanthaster planci]